MSKLLNPLALMVLSAALISGSAHAEGERTRADVIAELKAAQDSGELLAKAMEMEGVGHVIPKAIDGRATAFAKAKTEKKAEKSAAARASSAQPGSDAR